MIKQNYQEQERQGERKGSLYLQFLRENDKGLNGIEIIFISLPQFSCSNALHHSFSKHSSFLKFFYKQESFYIKITDSVVGNPINFMFTRVCLHVQTCLSACLHVSLSLLFASIEYIQGSAFSVYDIFSLIQSISLWLMKAVRRAQNLMVRRFVYEGNSNHSNSSEHQSLVKFHCLPPYAFSMKSIVLRKTSLFYIPNFLFVQVTFTFLHSITQLQTLFYTL